jgi:hypothetical protein
MTLQVGQAQKAPKGTSDSEFVYLLSPYRNKDTQAVNPLFLFAKRGTKMKIESQAILLQLVLTAKHRQLLRNHQLWLTKRKMPFWGVSLVATSDKGSCRP